MTSIDPKIAAPATAPQPAPIIGASAESVKRKRGHYGPSVTFDIAHYAGLPAKRRRLALVTLTHLVFNDTEPPGALAVTLKALVFAEREQHDPPRKRRQAHLRNRAEAVL